MLGLLGSLFGRTWFQLALYGLVAAAVAGFVGTVYKAGEKSESSRFEEKEIEQEHKEQKTRERVEDAIREA